MSDPELSESPSPLKRETKSKPEIPPKPSPSADSNSSLEISGGKVKNIVSRLSKQDLNGLVNGTADITPPKEAKRPPKTKPKPDRSSIQLQVSAEQTPPLPMKRSVFARKQKENEREEEADDTDGGRPAPDGKEVEAPTGGDVMEAEQGQHATPRTRCEADCSCICHLQRPGMMLVWVPVEEQEDEGVKEEQAGGVRDEKQTDGELESRTSEVDGDVKPEKAKFQQSLNALLAEAPRKLSDSTPPAVHLDHPPPEPDEDDEDNIYESTLPVFSPALKKTDKLVIPDIKVRTAARQSKLPSSTLSEPPNGEDPDIPPDIPPRVPITSTPIPAVAIDRCNSVRPASPSLPGARGLSPQRGVALPSSHTLQPVRVAPPPPRTDDRRHSSASLHAPSLNKEEESKGSEESELPVTRRDSIKKKISFIWESRLQHEPLYQTYRASVITKEIRRQTVCRNISKTSADYDWAARPSANGGGPRSSPVPTDKSTLWQDLPVVRDSGVLERLTPEECKYQESMFEVLTSETSYLRSLHVLTEHFLENRELGESLIIRDNKTLFSNILRVREVSERFLKDLEDRVFQDIVFPDICDIIHYHSQHNFPAYIDYVRNQIYQEKTYAVLMKTNAQFAAVITRLQESPQCQRLPFVSFLLLPFQRITRIKMLIENILKRTKEGTKEEQSASKALESVSKIIDECNTEVGKMRQVEELIEVSKTLEFDKLKAVPIISQNRYLEKRGELQEMSKGATLFNMRGKFSPVHFFLFNDLLVIAVKKGSERFVVVDHAHRSLVQAHVLEEGGGGLPLENCFVLTLLENHQGRMMERLIKAPSQSDMQRWLAVFPNPTNANGDEDEVVYEDWDCPQVQCVEQYVAQQADELSLEPAEIINVVRKTTEDLALNVVA
ncbi:ephexin-1 isoform X2 [Oryzias melastigma]|uniref:ephexin-1 isoform X2 n=1 Tax=Oryzias melastigma TaxID=30732 RepID=UPI00168D86CD|nr:ephexin-1 isoform X2 [Oryzias melastigma]